MKRLGRYWFFAGVAVVVLVGLLEPGVGAWLKRRGVLKVSIFLAFMVTGLTLETKLALREVRNFKALGASLAACFVLFPLVAVPGARWFWAQEPGLQVGATILAVAPVTIASGTVLSGLAGGNVALSLFICVTANLAAIFTMPFSLNLLLQFEQDIHLPAGQMIRGLVLIIVVPTVIGQMLRPRLKEWIAAGQKGFSIFSQVVVLLIILNAVAGSAGRIRQMGAEIGEIFLFVVVLHGVMLGLNYSWARLLRLDRPARITCTIHNSQKTLTISYLIWQGYFGQFPLALIPVIAHHMTQLVMDTVVARRFERRGQVRQGQVQDDAGRARAGGRGVPASRGD